VHGLGFADALRQLSLAAWPLARPLAGFNIGVELGQAVAIALVLPAMMLVRRLARAVLVYRGASLVVAAAGAYWLVERVYFE
jgi:HupE / UreJ protein